MRYLRSDARPAKDLVNFKTRPNPWKIHAAAIKRGILKHTLEGGSQCTAEHDSNGNADRKQPPAFVPEKSMLIFDPSGLP